ncbi:SDR family NAD(P)-dependent oxidoreductase [Gracilibacillus sp. D59]|uniref:SDR family NAD(P)-dependent oxidoreductase n=1 Tax=Gracilibacillus sp. D59 TaxID=3457434 RepID=UPI003FCD55D5
MFSFEDKVVWVTGSSTGIGRAIAIVFAEYGAKVIIHGNSNLEEAEKTLNTIKEKGGEALLVTGDVTQREQVNHMVSEIKYHFDHLDILINNAGTMVKRCKIEELEQKDWDKIIAINLSSIFHVTQSALPLLKKQDKAQIINMTSLAARNGGGKGAVAYAAAKGGVSTFTKGLAKELGDYNIRINGSCI